MSGSTADRMLCDGQVEFTFEKHINRHGYVKIFCIGMKGLPARIEVFDNQKAATKGKPPLFQILFKNVINIVTSEVQGKPRAFITLQEEDSFTFSSCNTGHNRWELIDYCKLVSKLPEHVIPEIPKRCLVSQQQIEQYGDCRRYSGASSWLVYFINEGVGPALKYTGLHIVTIQTTDLTFNIHNCYNSKHLLSWDHCNIRRSGRVGPLVFLEIGRRCQGGPGVLWMYYPDHLAGEFRESLQRFLHDNPSNAQSYTISVDANLNKTYLTRKELNLTLQEPEHQDTPPPLPAKPWKNMKNCHEDCSTNGQDDLDAPHDLRKYRARTTVISSRDGKMYKKNKFSGSKSYNDIPTVKSQSDDQNFSVKTTNASSKGSNSEEPPPLPPKPLASNQTKPPLPPKSRKYYPDKSVYECCEDTKSSSLSVERILVQPNRPQHLRQRRTNVEPRSTSQIQNAAFEACSKIMIDKLDVKSVLPELISCHLLTIKDRQFLINPMHEDYDKIIYLLYWLPRKANGWFEKFMQCLKRSSSSTGHGDIHDALSLTLKDIKDQNADMTALVSNPIPIFPKHVDDQEPYTVFVDSTDAVGTLQVRSSQSVDSLVENVRKEFSLPTTKPVMLKVDDRHLCDSRQLSLLDSSIKRYSYITVTVLENLID